MDELLSKVTEVSVESGPLGTNEKLKDGWILIDTHDKYEYVGEKKFTHHMFTVGKIAKDQ